MKSETNYPKTSQAQILTLLAAVIVLIMAAGCATGNYATFDRDRELNNMYLNYEVLPDHNYYTTGSYDGPDAILALKKEYELVNTGNLWVYRPGVNSALMQKWIVTIGPEDEYRRSNAYFAAYILDPAGKKIGAWYAIEPHTTVKFLENNQVQVYTPHKDFNIQLPRDIRKNGLL